MHLVKIPRSTSVDVSIYRKKRKAPFRNIKIIKSLKCKFKVANLYFRQKTDFGITSVLSVFAKLYFLSIYFV